MINADIEFGIGKFKGPFVLVWAKMWSQQGECWQFLTLHKKMFEKNVFNNIKRNLVVLNHIWSNHSENDVKKLWLKGCFLYFRETHCWLRFYCVRLPLLLRNDLISEAEVRNRIRRWKLKMFLMTCEWIIKSLLISFVHNT